VDEQWETVSKIRNREKERGKKIDGLVGSRVRPELREAPGIHSCGSAIDANGSK